MLNCQQSTVGTAGIQRSLLLKAGVGFGCQFVKSTRTATETHPSSTWTPPPSVQSLHPDEQSIEECAALLLSDPLDLWVAEARVQGLTVAKRLRSHLVGARTYAHLESHLSLVAAVRTGVLKLHFGSKDLQAGVAHGGGEPHSGHLPARGAVLFGLAVAIRPLGLYRRHREDRRCPCNAKITWAQEPTCISKIYSGF